MDINYSEKISQIFEFDEDFLLSLPVEFHSEYLLRLLRLHPRHFPKFIRKLNLFKELNGRALAALFDIGAYGDVMRNKSSFADLTDQDLAEMLLPEAADLLAENIELFENLDLNIGLAIIANNDGFYLEENLNSFNPDAQKIIWEKLKQIYPD